MVVRTTLTPPFHFAPELEEGEDCKSYTITAKTDDTGECNVGDEQKTATVTIECYRPYKVGLPPEGEIFPKPENIWSNTPTYRWDDQLVSKGTATKSFSAIEVGDLDDFENDPPPLLWDDGPKYDTPGESDIRWHTSAGEEKFGYNVQLTVPVGGITEPVTWTIDLYVDDDTTPPCMADDPENKADTTQYRVYHDHLARDKNNEGDLNTIGPGGNPISPANACFGAANHAYNGQTDPVIVPTTPGEEVFRRSLDPVTRKPIVGLSEIVVNKFGTFSIGRGDWFVYNTFISHINTSYSGTSIWEFNGRMNPQRWGTSTVDQYIAEHHLDGDGDDIYGVVNIYYHPKN